MRVGSEFSILRNPTELSVTFAGDGELEPARKRDAYALEIYGIWRE